MKCVGSVVVGRLHSTFMLASSWIGKAPGGFPVRLVMWYECVHCVGVWLPREKPIDQALLVMYVCVFCQVLAGTGTILAVGSSN